MTIMLFALWLQVQRPLDCSSTLVLSIDSHAHSEPTAGYGL